MMPPPPPPPPPPHPGSPHILEANGRYQSKPESPVFIVFLNVINTLTQLFLGAVCFSAFTFAAIFNTGSALTQHIYLCVIGYVILMSQAILAFNSHAGWTYSLQYPQKKMIHWGMQIIGSILAIVGSLIRLIDVSNSNNNWTDSLQTAHGITGLIAMLLTVLSLIGGVLNFFFSQSKSTLFKTLHSCFGSLTISVAFISLCLAFNDWNRDMFGDLQADLSIALTMFALAGILFSLFHRLFVRLTN